MNGIACTIFFVVGCFGQQNIVPPLPQLQNGIPNVSSLTNGITNGIPSVSSLTNGIPSLPSVTNGITNGIPSVSSLTNGITNGIPSVSSLTNGITNGIPSVPSLTNGITNGIPSVPSLTNGITNGIPSLSSLTNGITNGIPSLPSLTNGASNGISNLPIPSGLPGLPLPPNAITNIPSLTNGTSNGIPSLPTGVPSTPAPEIFERPCRTSDLGCIRRYFQHHSKCLPAHGRVPDPLYRAISNQFYSNVNITATNLNPEYSGFNNARIQEFYINRDTDKLVIAIEFRDLQISSKDSFFRYSRRGREPIITHGFSSIFFGSVVVTATIPQVDNLRLDKSDSFAYSNDAQPTVVVDPSLGQSSDPTVTTAFAAFQAGTSINILEYFLTESSFMAATYIQCVICDFGLQLI